MRDNFTSLVIILLISLSGLSYAQLNIEELDKSASFSFSVMSDNKGYSIENPHMNKCVDWIKESGDEFIIGLGDHVKINRPNPFLELIAEDSLWHNHFYPNVADGENEYWGKDQGDWGAGAPILDYVELRTKQKVRVRRNNCEYYAIEEHNGIKLHIIQLHYSDTPLNPSVAFNENSRQYLMKTLDGIRKTENDIIVVLAHNGDWFNQLSEFRRNILFKKADLILGATTHHFKRYELSNNSLTNGAIALNSGSVGNSPDNGFLQVHVLKYPTRIIVQYQRTKYDTRRLQAKGFVYEKTVNGAIKEIDWHSYNKQSLVWGDVKPFVENGLLGISNKFDKYEVILKPDKDEKEYWAGAPSVVRDSNGTFWMAARMRSPEYSRGLRGYEIRILKSENGVIYSDYHVIKREGLPIPGFERPSLLIDHDSGKFKLYVCGPWQNGPWSILKFSDVDDLKDIEPKSAVSVIQAPPKRYDRDVSVREYKDPVITFAEGEYHCYVIGYIRKNERIFHYKSLDGEKWFPVGDINQPILDLSNWHNFFIRPASILPLGIGYLFIYEGSSTSWYDPVYNIGTGLGFTFDLHTITDLTPNSPLVLSTTPGNFYTFRYSHWMWVNDEIWVYAEVANKNDSNEIRLYKIIVD